jgi:ABC-type molybdate transport system substrate-binding protein
VGRMKFLALAAVAAVAMAACGDDDGGSAGSSGEIDAISTATPLEPVVTELVDAYNETSNAGIELAVAPQDQAVDRVSQGAPAILPTPWLSGTDADSVVIGRSLAIIGVPAGNPAQVNGVDAFASHSGLETMACGANSPSGNLAAAVLSLGHVEPDPARLDEGCDADALARVARGELDAALVFRGNVQVPEGVEVITIPDDENVVIDVAYAPAADDASRDSFQGFLESDTATQILSRHGLLP